MAKVRNLLDIYQEIAFTELDSYQRYKERLKFFIYTRRQGCLGIHEDVYGRILSSEADGGLEWKYTLSDLQWNQCQS